jgi:hypothetical protein
VCAVGAYEATYHTAENVLVFMKLLVKFQIYTTFYLLSMLFYKDIMLGFPPPFDEAINIWIFTSVSSGRLQAREQIYLWLQKLALS